MPSLGVLGRRWELECDSVCWAVQVTLAQGSGARRLAEVRCRAAIQLLLVQASGEIYAAHSQRLPQAGAILMLDALAEMAQHARDVDADLDMRRLLAAAQADSKVSLLPQHDAAVPYDGFLATSINSAVQDKLSCLGSMAMLHLEDSGRRRRLWRPGSQTCAHDALLLRNSVQLPPGADVEVASPQVPEGKALGDPPLLRLEGEACHAYLSMLLHLNTAASEPLQEAADVERRLMQLCTANLRCFQVREPAFHRPYPASTDGA